MEEKCETSQGYTRLVVTVIVEGLPLIERVSDLIEKMNSGAVFMFQNAAEFSFINYEYSEAVLDCIFFVRNDIDWK